MADALTRKMPGGKMVEPPKGKKVGDMPGSEMQADSVEAPAVKKVAARRRAPAKTVAKGQAPKMGGPK